MAMTEMVDDAERRVEAAALAAAACLFHRFSDRARLAIVRHLLLLEHREHVNSSGHTD